ncbi:MAG: hypothetical protein ABIN99_07910 [Nitrosospira sp.]
MESQTGLAGVLCDEAQSAASYEEAIDQTDAATIDPARFIRER